MTKRRGKTRQATNATASDRPREIRMTDLGWTEEEQERARDRQRVAHLSTPAGLSGR
jgi:hypothetical protein